eukprot:sb/3468409/
MCDAIQLPPRQRLAPHTYHSNTAKFFKMWRHFRGVARFPKSFFSIGAKCIGAKSIGAKCIGAKSIGAKCIGAKSIGAKCIGAKSIGAKCIGAKSIGAKCIGAKSIGAKCIGAKSIGAKCIGAKSIGAKCIGAKSIGAKCIGAKSIGAKCIGAKSIGATLAPNWGRSAMAVVNRHMAVPIAIWRLEVAPHPGSGAISALAVLLWRLSLALFAVSWRQLTTATAILIGANVYLMAPFMLYGIAFIWLNGIPAYLSYGLILSFK